MDQLAAIVPEEEEHVEGPISSGLVRRGEGLVRRATWELVAEDDVFKRDVATRSEEGKKTAEQEAEEREHPPG